MTKKRFGAGSLISIIVTVLFLGGLIAICIIAKLAFTDNYSSKYSSAPYDDSLVTTVVKSAIIGNKFDITDDQLNTYINKKYTLTSKEEGTGLEKVRIYTHAGKTEIYAKVRYLGYSTGIYCKTLLSCNLKKNILTAEIYDVYVGELSVSDDIVKRILPKIFENNPNISIDGTKISVHTEYNYKLDDCDISLMVTSFLPSEGKISCRTNSLTLETIKVLHEYCNSEEGKEKIREVFSIDIDEIKDVLKEAVKQKISEMIPDIPDLSGSVKDKIKNKE